LENTFLIQIRYTLYAIVGSSNIWY